ncbi:sugar transferase [Bdellovibrio sp. HCB337]|uniref:sugar transferase n=1 Tax=Bdellovibrio sp. HCB337 TaxID=3394358 RepID=UPI0039A6112B
MIKRIFDFVVSFVLLFVIALPVLLIAIAIKVNSKGPVIHWSQRVGRRNNVFSMPKFRSMKTDTPQVATHLLSTSQNYVTSVGAFLRKSSLDELPQLWSVLVGDMSFVGPRPALFNQDDLIALRTENGVDALRPGITGWAQVNGRDELSIPVKVQFDKEYLENRSFWFDLKIMVLTVLKVFMREGIHH